MKFSKIPAISYLVIVTLIAMSANAIEINTEWNNGADSYVRSGTYAGANYGASNELMVKSTGGDYSRKSYLRFDLSGIHIDSITNATLKLIVNSREDPAPGLVNVFSLNDLDAGESWGEGTITWTNAPANNTSSANGVIGSLTTDLGDMDTSDYPVGTLVTFSSAALATAIQNDTNDLFTLILTRVNTDNTSVGFASKENTTYPAPLLELAIAVPEPGTLGLLALGGLCLAFFRRRRR